MTNKQIKINVQGTEIAIYTIAQKDYISLTDIAKYRNSGAPADVVKNWLRSRSTIEFLGLWEKLNNPDFKLVEFDQFRNDAGSNYFVLSPKKWIDSTKAIGITSKSGKYGGTFAHQDIAFEFASWISAEFKLYILKEFQRLKQEEIEQNRLEWNVSRTIAKVNYVIHTDAVKAHLIPEDISKHKRKFIYADEADLLNIALFGMTAMEWRKLMLNARRKLGLLFIFGSYGFLYKSSWSNTRLSIIVSSFSKDRDILYFRFTRTEKRPLCPVIPSRLSDGCVWSSSNCTICLSEAFWISLGRFL